MQMGCLLALRRQGACSVELAFWALEPNRAAVRIVQRRLPALWPLEVEPAARSEVASKVA